jgi:hypothetical protein
MSNDIYKDAKEYLIELMAEEALENDEDIIRKDKIEKLLNILNARNDCLFLRHKNITIRYYCLNPKDYNECDTAMGKERLSPFEDDEPFIEEIHIGKEGMKQKTKLKIAHKHNLNIL